ncbi:tripartite tricarboxylate transporter TctB family protein, partial [Amylibacter sp.]|nr:tripartite tricarboxylate transporter TctB family protein [Amylibacter sp.]
AGTSLVTRLLKPSNEGGFGEGIWWRRVLFISAMFITCFAMPIIGFLASGVIAFTSGLIAAMHDKWSFRTVLIYGCSGAIIMVSFFILFKFILFVPLP